MTKTLANRAALLAGTAFLALTTATHAAPVFEITVKKVVDTEQGTQVEAAPDEQVQTKAEQRITTSKRVKVPGKKIAPARSTRSTGPSLAGAPAVLPVQKQALSAGEKAKLDDTSTASVTARGAPSRSAPTRSAPTYETRNFVRVIPAQYEARRPIDIKTVFDGLDAKPVLNAHIIAGSSTILRGEPLALRGLWNYSAFIRSGEVRLFENGAALDGKPLLVAPLDEYREASIDTAALPDNLVYVVRVYSHDLRFDETKPKAVALVDDLAPATDGNAADPITVLEDVRDASRIRNIDVAGGSVIIRGRHVGDDERVSVLGTEIRVSQDGEFEAQEILPFGDHTIPVAISGPRAKLVEREMHVPTSEWFYVGHADVTVGRNISHRKQYRSGNIDVIGKGGLYLKGKIKGEYLVTASIDTEEDEPRHLLSNVARRKADGLLNRIDPNKYYPVFGDSSSIEEDAPTRSNLYVRVDRGNDYAMWGSYDATIASADLVELNRGLYGARAGHRSKAVTSRGEARTEATVFAASLETAANYEVLTGTGGTVYRFSRQDILAGTVRLQVETRNRTTGNVINMTALQEGRDYTVDHLQGRIILAQPLSTHLQGVNATVNADQDIVLAARYEFTPSDVDLDGYAIGGRASHWVSDNLRVGVTGQTEKTDTIRRNIIGADVLAKHSANTWFKAEVARSSGPGRFFNGTIDGGLSFQQVTPTANGDATAYRAAANIDLAEISGSAIRGSLGGYYEQFEDGFAGKILRYAGDSRNWGAHATLGDADILRGTLAYDETVVSGTGRKRLISAKVSRRLNQHWNVEAGVVHDWVSDGSSFSAVGLAAQTNRSGSRTDVSARIGYEVNEFTTAYLLGQATAERTGNRRRNDRVGVGMTHRFNDAFAIGASVSYGTSGWGGEAELTYTKDEKTSITLGYAYVQDLADAAEIGGIGSRHAQAIKLRGNHRYNEHFSVFSESTFGLDNGFRLEDRTNAFGMEIKPDERWTFTALLDAGLLSATTNDDYRRRAASIGADFSGERLKVAAALEARFDRGQNRDADLWAGRIGTSYKADDDWIVLASLDASYADGLGGVIADSRYTKGTLAGAYRPVENDALNALFKYAYVQDLSPRGQIGVNGFSQQPRQNSHVLSADFDYDVTDTLTIGAKYAYRHGEIALSRDSGVFAESRAHLGVARADYKVNKDWEVMLEGRMLAVEDTDRELGLLAGVWYNANETVKVGGGYSLAHFSDDLTDLSTSNDGWFTNVAARF